MPPCLSHTAKDGSLRSFRVVPKSQGMGARLRGWDTAGLVALVLAGGLSFYLNELSGYFQLAFAVLGLVFIIRTTLQKTLPRRVLRAWRMMLPSYALWPLTIVGYAFFPGQAFPSPPDWLRLLIGPATLVGILAFARMPGSKAERAKLWLDAGLIAVGAAMVLWFLVVSPAFALGRVTWQELFPSLFHPLIDVALLFGISVVLLRGPGGVAARRPLLTVVAATMMTLSGDVLRANTLIHGGPVMPTATQSLLWTAGIFLLMLAPYVQCWYCRRPELAAFTADHGRTAPPRWPYLAVIPGYALLMIKIGVPQPFPAGGLIVGAFLVSTLVFGRQMVAAQESRRLAVTDGLTGLANRVQLYEALPRALAKAARNDAHVGVLVLDMNGFKQVNDTLGHAAGDRLLVGFGELLRRCVLGSDLVARLGGDEFAIVLPDLQDAAQVQAVVRRIRAATAEPIDVGETVVQPSASIGVALSEPGELSADDVLNRADLAMYESKKSRDSAPVPGTTGA